MSQIIPNSVVFVTYELHTNENGEMVHVETAGDANPLVFIYGIGSMIPKFEENLSNLKVSDTFEFKILAEEAYGLKDPDALVKVPKEAFMVDGVYDQTQFQPGMFLPMRDMEGNVLQALVLDVDDEGLKMDFNHPMAGKDLFFKGVIQKVRPATQEELDHGHVHGDGGVNH